MTAYPRQRRRPGKRKLPNPYMRFIAATDRATRLHVAEDDAAQAQARALVCAGMVGYENARGYLRDLGWAREDRDAGKVYSRREGTPVP